MPLRSVLSKDEINKYLKPGYVDEIKLFDEIDSTNTYAKSIAFDENSHCVLIAADSQTNGRGRLGRNFYSPFNDGIYMSIAFDFPSLSTLDPGIFTTTAALSVSEALKNICHVETGIKWVNDIFFKGRKISGILTEGIANYKTHSFDRVIVGIGINLFIDREKLPLELSEIVGSVFETKTDDNVLLKNRIIAETVNIFFEKIFSDDRKSIMNEYRSKSLVIGKNVKVISPNFSYDALVLNIDDDGALIVRNEKGNIERINSGEVSIRLNKAENV